MHDGDEAADKMVTITWIYAQSRIIAGTKFAGVGGRGGIRRTGGRCQRAPGWRKSKRSKYRPLRFLPRSRETVAHLSNASAGSRSSKRQDRHDEVDRERRCQSN